MDKVKIIGLGIISRLGNEIDSVWKSLSLEDFNLISDDKVNYISQVPKNKRRRMNRYSDMVVCSAVDAVKDAKLELEQLDPFRVGTIYSTGYGPLNSNLEFTQMLLKGDPDLCSPTVFANTVSNACIGQVCMHLGLKGVSTIVMGSNSIGYSQMLISKGVADYILTGGIEEYNSDLYLALKNNKYSKNVYIAEASISLLLSNIEVKKDAYCELVDFAEINIGKYPLVNPTTEFAKNQMESLLSSFLSKHDSKSIDYVFNANNKSYFDRTENEVLKKFFDESVIITDLKKYAGETLGASLSVTIAIAALCLKKNKVPRNINKNLERKSINKILVTGYDVTGNYVLYLLQK